MSLASWLLASPAVVTLGGGGGPRAISRSGGSAGACRCPKTQRTIQKRTYPESPESC